MLGASEGEQSAKAEAWFRNRIAGVLKDVPLNFEQTRFTLDYLKVLQELVESAESHLQVETHRLTSASEYLSHQIALKRKIVEIPLDETAEALGKLAVMLESDGASLPSIVQGLDKLETNVRMTSESLKGAKSLSSAVQVCSDEIAEIKEKISQAERAFNGWVKRDILAGIEELKNATRTVQCKRKEYKERLAHIRSQDPKISDKSCAASLVDKLDSIRQKQEILEQIQDSLRPYNQLPPDPTLATIEVERARQQLVALLSQRDQLLRRV